MREGREPQPKATAPGPGKEGRGVDSPPLYSLTASPRASMDSMSKLLVGSSCGGGVPRVSGRTPACTVPAPQSSSLTKMRTSGSRQASSANTTRAFCPPAAERKETSHL